MPLGMRVLGAGVCLPESREYSYSGLETKQPYAMRRPRAEVVPVAHRAGAKPRPGESPLNFDGESTPQSISREAEQLSPGRQDLSLSATRRIYQKTLATLSIRFPWLAHAARIPELMGFHPGPRKTSGSAMAIDMALPACRQALAAAGLHPEQVDLILSSSVSPDHLSDDPSIAGPRLGHPIQRELKAKNAFVFDLVDADWAFAIDVASGFCCSMGYRRILVVRAECTAAGVLPDPSSGFEIPDGAGALLLTSEPAEVDWSTTYCALPPEYKPVQVRLVSAEIRARSTARAALSFPYHPGLADALQSTAAQCIQSELTHGCARPDLLVYESWLPEPKPPSHGDLTVARIPENVGCLGPFTLPYVLASQAGANQISRILSLTFNPFQMRCACQQLVFSRT